MENDKIQDILRIFI